MNVVLNVLNAMFYITFLYMYLYYIKASFEEFLILDRSQIGRIFIVMDMYMYVWICIFMALFCHPYGYKRVPVTLIKYIMPTRSQIITFVLSVHIFKHNAIGIC